MKLLLPFVMVSLSACGGLIAPDLIDADDAGDQSSSGGETRDSGSGGSMFDAGHDARAVDSGIADAGSDDSSFTRDDDAEVADITPCISSAGNLFYVVPMGVADASDAPVAATPSTGTWGNDWFGTYLGVYVVNPGWAFGMEYASNIAVGNYSFGEPTINGSFGVVTPTFTCQGPADIRIDELDEPEGDLQRLLLTFRVQCNNGGESGSISGCVSYSNP